jgi:CRP/FNR family cyclic AMP-dependent transcriptional regulator
MLSEDLLLASGATYKKVGTNESIFHEGAECHFYYQLVSGSVRWVNITDEGREFIQCLVQPGECFGELPLFDDEPYTASAFADKDSVVIRLQKQTFKQLLKEDPELSFKFTRMIVQRTRFKFQLIKELACSDPEHKVNTLFKHFKISKKYICPDCNRVQLTRQQIADMTGLRVETVIRTIKNLATKGSLSILKGKVYC